MNFAKLHGAGNDFLLFDGAADASLPRCLPERVRRLCDRHLGLGADGVLLLTPRAEAELQLEYWNADGSHAAFCANGTRCAARFAARRWGWSQMLVHTGFGAIPARVVGADVELDLPAPSAAHYWQNLSVLGDDLRARYLVVGVPQLIVPVTWPDFWRRPLAPLAPLLRAHPDLPSGGANVNFVVVEDDKGLAVRSWERGVEAETLACGSGDVAAALVAVAEGWVSAPVQVRTASGRTLVVVPTGTAPITPTRLLGPAEWIADGVVSNELLGE